MNVKRESCNTKGAQHQRLCRLRMGHRKENKGLGGASPQRTKMRAIGKRQERKQYGGVERIKTYVANEKLGASIFEGNVTTV